MPVPVVGRFSRKEVTGVRFSVPALALAETAGFPGLGQESLHAGIAQWQSACLVNKLPGSDSPSRLQTHMPSATLC